jgi:hypothetical protein
VRTADTGPLGMGQLVHAEARTLAPAPGVGRTASCSAAARVGPWAHPHARFGAWATAAQPLVSRTTSGRSPAADCRTAAPDAADAEGRSAE